MLIRHLLPAPLRQVGRAVLRDLHMQIASGPLHDLPIGAAPSVSMIERLARAWRNEPFAARQEYLDAVIAYALATPGPIVECGSGITTVLLSLLAARRGVTMISLEHMLEWREDAEFLLRHVGAWQAVTHAPLVSYGDFDWYDMRGVAIPRDVALVVCDGPPGVTRGGRYGALPILQPYLARDAVILLDDVMRPDEQAILARWAHAGWQHTIHGTFAVVAARR